MAFWEADAPVTTNRFRSRPRPVILVADDDRDTRELYRACFDLSGYRTAEAETGGEALTIAQRLLPDLLLMDLMLPGVDGLTVARALKADVRTSGVRVILVTGYSCSDLQQRAAAAGVEKALLKPCLPQAMLREARRVLARLPAHSAPMAAS
jgi:two-component system cell cycle response regulator DivK